MGVCVNRSTQGNFIPKPPYLNAIRVSPRISAFREGAEGVSLVNLGTR